ncbi:MAG: hypothetical protein H0U76_18075 [Ktedonobacteraceae bacterium]|nr:hypothetical protein [Ktedonobacteraceae bacterium]
MPEVHLSIPYPYNGGEWRISQQVIGPRGGKKWERIIKQPATGGTYITDLEPGLYKETYWTNGWPSSSTFEVTEEGVQREDEDDFLGGRE